MMNRSSYDLTYIIIIVWYINLQIKLNFHILVIIFVWLYECCLLDTVQDKYTDYAYM